MGILKYFIYCLSAIIFTSCYEIFSPDVEAPPVLCISSLIKAGEKMKIEVTHTWVYSDFDAMQNHEVKDAVISIFANDILVDNDYIPKEGDRIRIYAESKKFGNAVAETEVPFSTSIKISDCEINMLSRNIFSDENFNINIFLYFNLFVKIEISDVSDLTDYYHISFKTYDIMSPLSGDLKDPDYFNDYYFYFSGGYLDYDAEPLFYENAEEFESIYGSPTGFNFFTDKLFSGGTYTLNLVFLDCAFHYQADEWNPDFLDCGKMITLNTISKSYYDWEYYYHYIDTGILNDMTYWGFIDPIWGYSNVSTGAGVVAAESSNYVILNLREKLENILGIKD